MILSKYMLNYVLIAPFLQMLDDLKKENKILRKKQKNRLTELMRHVDELDQIAINLKKLNDI